MQSAPQLEPIRNDVIRVAVGGRNYELPVALTNVNGHKHVLVQGMALCRALTGGLAASETFSDVIVRCPDLNISNPKNLEVAIKQDAEGGDLTSMIYGHYWKSNKSIALTMAGAEEFIKNCDASNADANGKQILCRLKASEAQWLAIRSESVSIESQELIMMSMITHKTRMLDYEAIMTQFSDFHMPPPTNDDEMEALKEKMIELESKAQRLLTDDVKTCRSIPTGWVYAAKTSSYPDMIKIGASWRTDVGVRIKELQTAGVLEPFRLVACVKTPTPFALEKSIHDHFNYCRKYKNKEFFTLKSAEVKAYFKNLQSYRAPNGPFSDPPMQGKRPRPEDKDEMHDLDMRLKRAEVRRIELANDEKEIMISLLKKNENDQAFVREILSKMERTSDAPRQEPVHAKAAVVFVGLYLSAVSNTDFIPETQDFRVRPQQLFDHAMAFSNAGDYDYRGHITRFCARTIEIIGIERRSCTGKGGSAIYEISRGYLKKMLQKELRYNAYIVLPPGMELEYTLPPTGRGGAPPAN